MDELYAGGLPLGVDPRTAIPLGLEDLRRLVGCCVRERGWVPAAAGGA